MKSVKLFLTSLLSATLLMAANAFAGSSDGYHNVNDEGTSKLIILRGAESAKTRSLNFNVYVGDQSIGRVKVDSATEIEVKAGSHKVRSNFYQDQALKVELQPNKTYYLVAKMNRKSNKFHTAYELVSEDYAFSVMPSLDEAANSI